MSRKQTTAPPFVKAYSHIMHHPYLTPGERLVLTIICRFWPNQCWMSNDTIAYETGLSKRHVQKCIARLKNQLTVNKHGKELFRPPMLMVIWDNDPYDRKNYTRRWIIVNTSLSPGVR